MPTNGHRGETKKGGWWHSLGRALLGSRRQVLSAFALALLLLALLWFIPFFGLVLLDAASIVFSIFGFGLLIILGWIGLLWWILWRRLPQRLRRWNLWPAMLLFSAALFALLAFFRPGGWGVGSASLAQVSAGGYVGQTIIGAPDLGGFLRLSLLVVVGVAFVSPRALARWVRGTARGVLRFFGHELPEVAGPVVKKIQSKALPPRLRPARAAPPAPEQAPAELVPSQAQGDKVAPPRRWQLPSLSVLSKGLEVELSQADLEKRARMIEEALASYGVDAKVVQINPGPAVTQFGVEPGWDIKYRKVVEKDADGKPRLDRNGQPKVHMEEVSRTRVKVERITSLGNDLALALAVSSLRMEAPVPGKSVVGLEIPNAAMSLVGLRGILETNAFQKAKGRSKLALALGRGAAGEAIAADLAKMPHLLIAGATGSGKTVCLNSIITCLLMHDTPDDLRLILVDPKRVELAQFNSVPHLLGPVVVDGEGAVSTLRRVTHEMESRYRKMASVGARDIEGYNRSPKVRESLPCIVVIIDELADLMAAAPDIVEHLICRLAQLARATGIHLIVATQRPSVDVVTGLIKANFPTRISFAVVSQVDSRTILDSAGAEKLLGRGDMLYLPPDAPKPKRLQGVLVTDKEIEQLVAFWAKQRITPLFTDEVAKSFATLKAEEDAAEDPLLEKARELAQQHTRLSTSLLQRRLRIGYPRAARLLELLEEEGTVSSPEHTKSQEAASAEGDEEK